MIHNKLKAVLALKGTNLTQFATHIGTTRQNISKKGKNDAYYLKEVILLSDFISCNLAIVDKENNVLIKFDKNDIK